MPWTGNVGLGRGGIVLPGSDSWMRAGVPRNLAVYTGPSAVLKRQDAMDGYTSSLYALTYPYDGQWYSTVMRFNATDGTFAAASDPPWLVVMISGGTGEDVYKEVDEDTIMAEATKYLASGRELQEDREEYPIRGAPAMFTLQVNLPGTGDGVTAADGNTDAVNYSVAAGADFGGPMSVALVEAAATVAFDLIRDTGAKSRARVMVASFSAGIMTAARLLADWRRKVHCYVDVEGPSDSFAATFMPDCFLSEGLGAAVGNPWLTSTEMTDCYARTPADGSDNKFQVAYDEVIGLPWTTYAVYEWLLLLHSGTAPPLPDGTTPDKDYLLAVLAWWRERSVTDALEATDVPYVRIQGRNDHAQDSAFDQYQNYHAIVAVESAVSSTARAGEVYLFLDEGQDPTLYADLPDIIDVTDYETFPDWPLLGDEATNQGRAGDALADVLRWAWSSL
jgi:hypothetical protein